MFSFDKKANNIGSSPVLIIVVSVMFLVAVIGFLVWDKNHLGNVGSTASPTLESSSTPTSLGSPTPTPKATKTPTPTPAKTATPTPTPTTISVVLGANGPLDGFEASNGGGNTGVEIRAGRNSTLIERGFVSFDIPSSLSGKTIVSATLRLYQGNVIGTPYSDLGSLKVDHLDYGGSLENGDYSTSSLSTSFGTLTTNATNEWKDLDVKDMFIDDMGSGRPRSQYRIHFATESTGADAFAYFESSDNSMGTGFTPQLVVKYH